ncbi:hypothetical protein [Cupriavidus basilensis]|uniref:hypothetical protein n=1 Tax=Cupriavidus basilensis TaxID=68895 RepID=UPI0020A68AED|nr:hypothetical protein [Cupriavidus basilensis]MCP3018739.1 hypothetical protein [Cupriavidus basilensis]
MKLSVGLAQAWVVVMIGGLIISFLLFAIADIIRRAKNNEGWQSARAWVKRLAWLAVLFIGIHYWLDVRVRAKAHDCETQVSSEDSAYRAELCFVPNFDSEDFRMRLRLFRADAKEPLAERVYEHPDPKLTWTRDSLIYDTSASSEQDGMISLPPTWKDRLRARLP